MGGVVLDLDQAGVTRWGHSQFRQFNVHPGDIPGFGQIFRAAHARCDF
jgi:hypothetical protein